MNTFEDGKEAQFQQMMQELAQIAAKYKGVRAELLAKVRDGLARLNPSAHEAANTPTVAPTPPAPPAPTVVAATAKRAPNPVTEKMLPSCRMCGRTMKASADGNLVCERGHTRTAA